MPDRGAKPPKAILTALERVFSAEIEGRLPFQSSAKVYQRLVADGLVQELARTIGTGWTRVTVSGYELTHAGRILYCSNCEDVEL